jgi:hypothetical protein
LARIRTFIDSGVLIAAFRGVDEIGETALQILADPDREFISSDFVRLELVPKPVFYGRNLEREFYETFFEAARRFIRTSRTLIEEAISEAKIAGLSAVDALHVAAARRANCKEFITTERPSKPLFRVVGLAVISIYPVSE